MFDLLFITSIIGSSVQAIKEACTPTIPAENWANKELYYKDLMDGVSTEERIRNLKNGKYRLAEMDCDEEKQEKKECGRAKHRYLYKP